VHAVLSRAKIWLAAVALSVAALSCPAAAQPTAKSDHAEGTLVFERSAATPGDSFQGALKLDLADGWHVYWRNPGDSGLPPTATWTSAPGVTFGDFRFPAPHAIPLATLMNYGYEHQVVLPFQIQIAADAKPGQGILIGGKFEYLICADICIPEDIELSTTLRIAATPETDNDGSAVIIATLPHIPVAMTGKASVERTGKGFRISAADPGIAGAVGAAKNIRFFPDGPDILHPAKQTVKTGADGVSIEVTASDFAKPGDQNLSGIIVVTDAAGSAKAWEVAATPGPALAGVADKEFVNADTSGLAPTPVADVPPMGFGDLMLTLGFAFLGGLVLNLMPCVLPVLTIKAAGLVHTAHDPKVSRSHGIAYLGGVVLCFAAIGAILIALRAAGDQAGLGFQLQYPPITALFALIMFAVGLNLLGVFEIGGSLMGVGGNIADKGGTSGAFFTGLLAAFVGAPCVGPFMAPAVGVAISQPPYVVMAVFVMIGIGLAAPFVLLSFTPAFAKVLPKPGKWMETFRQVLAFPMFLTVLWLLWVLAGQSGPDGIIAVLAGAIALGFSIWLARRIGGNLPGKIIAGLLILASFVVPSVATTWFNAKAEITANAWSTEKVAELQAEGRVIFVDFTARWCVTCQFNKSAIHDASVTRTFADLDVAFLEADWTNKDSVIAAELAKHGAAGVPLYLVYPASGGAPVKLDQLLTPGMIEKAVREAAGSL
jgi:thiol:disulfide interchange protein/DsbC/DsbD-like thiol-disulfide interchange protein